MVTLGEIFRDYGPTCREKYGERMLPSHRRAMWAIEHCRTPALGGHVYHCAQCDTHHYYYHSCRNRHCPQCQTLKGQQWLADQQALLLPVPYFMLTFTLPEALREVARRHQKLLYDGLFRASAAALQHLAAAERFVGGQLGMVGVLHTWGRNLSYHPHVHSVHAGVLNMEGDRIARSMFHNGDAIVSGVPVDLQGHPPIFRRQPFSGSIVKMNPGVVMGEYLFRSMPLHTPIITNAIRTEIAIRPPRCTH